MKKLISLISTFGKSKKQIAEKAERVLKQNGEIKKDNGEEYQELQVHFFRKNPKYPSQKSDETK